MAGLVIGRAADLTQAGLRRIDKHVEYFTFRCRDGAPRLGPRPRGTRERRWVSVSQLTTVPLVSGALGSLIADGFALVAAHRENIVTETKHMTV